MKIINGTVIKNRQKSVFDVIGIAAYLGGIFEKLNDYELS